MACRSRVDGVEGMAWVFRELTRQVECKSKQAARVSGLPRAWDKHASEGPVARWW